MERIKRIIDAVKAFFTPRRRAVLVQPIPPQQRQAGGPQHARPFNPAMHAYQNIFHPRHTDEQQVAYRQVPPSGVVMQETEEWFREGNNMRSRIQRSLVVTVSGAVVSPDQVRLKCGICGGFDNIVQHCARCGRGLCKICLRRFRPPNGPEIILCERDLRATIDELNVWQLRQRRNP